MTTPPALLTADEVAAWVGVSVATLKTWRTRGGGPEYVLAGRLPRYQVADVQAWLDASKRARTPVPAGQHST